MKYIAIMLISLILTNSAFAVTAFECRIMRDWDEETYRRFCYFSSPEKPLTEEEFSSLTDEQREILSNADQEPEKQVKAIYKKYDVDYEPKETKVERIVQLEPKPVTVNIDNHLPAPVVHETVKESGGSSSVIWFIVGVLGGGAASYYLIKR